MQSSQSGRVVALILAGASAAFVLAARQPPSPVGPSAPPATFSADRAWHHVEALAARPHPVATAAHDSARAYVERELRALSIEPEVQLTTGIGTRGRSAARVANIVARIPGARPGGKAILVAVHYDGVPSGPAAGDDGAGVAAVLEMLRALRNGPMLLNDLIILVSDAEEVGLLGASAFVAEHRWAKDVALVLDFEARGTTGRSMMFETGANNLDVVRALRSVRDVSASSLMVTVYRVLPNDTDLSELARLGQPALNFAFIGGVTRYHTPFDNAEQLNRGSLQHHGQQLLALVRRFGREPLPRPVTTDAVFFDLPVIGIVWYPEPWALPIAILVAIAAVGGAVRASRGEPRRLRAAALGASGMVASVAVAAMLNGWVARAIVGWHAYMQWDGEPGWSGVYAAALVLAALAIAAGGWALVRRWVHVRGAWTGALIVWAVLAIVVAVMLPGVSYLLAWPLAGAAVLAWSEQFDTRVSAINGWAGILVALAVVVPVISMVGGYALPLDQLGAQAAAALVALTTWLLAPRIDEMLGGARWRGVAMLVTAAVVVTGYGMATVRRSAMAPTPVDLLYAMPADSGDAWLATSASEHRTGSWAAAALGSSAERPAAMAMTVPLRAMLERSRGWNGWARKVERLPLAGASVAVRSVTLSATGTTYNLLIAAPADAQAVSFRTVGATVREALVDGRRVDQSRYRRASPDFSLTYFAPAREGVALTLDVKGAAPFDLDVATLRYGVALVPLAIPPRPPHVVPVHQGDQTMVVQRVRLARP